MQVFNKFIATAVAYSLSLITVSAQSVGGITITSPSMPTISSPTINSGYYRPASTGAYSYQKDNSSSQSTQSAPSLSEGESDEKSTTIDDTAKKILSTLTAGDIQAMSKNGMLNQIGQILGMDSATLASSIDGSTLSNLYISSSTEETTVLLQQILTEIEELKAQNAAKKTETSTTEAVAEDTKSTSEQNTSSSKEEVAITTSNATEVSTKSTTKPSHLIRFSVNGYDVLRTCRTIYISDVQQDGTFLVTGDRKYQSDGQTRAETFHLLFKVTQNAGADTYKAAAAVTQDTFNEYSFLYQMSQRDDLKATRTGNLVSMRTTDPSWKLELLIDLGEEK